MWRPVTAGVAPKRARITQTPADTGMAREGQTRNQRIRTAAAVHRPSPRVGFLCSWVPQRPRMAIGVASALARLEAGIDLVDHKDPPLAPHDAAVLVALFQCLQ